MLARFIGQLFDQRMDPYFRRLASYFEDASTWSQALAEHRFIRDAIAAGDPEAARQAMRQHLSSLKSDFKEVSAKLQCYPTDRARSRPYFAVERKARASCKLEPAGGKYDDSEVVSGCSGCTWARDYGRAAQAQTKLKWAHVYEINEPFHTQSVWAAGESPSAPTALHDRRLSLLAARQGNRHQSGPVARFRRHDHFRVQLCRPHLSRPLAGPIILTCFAMRTISWLTPRATSSRSWPRAIRTRPDTRSLR